LYGPTLGTVLYVEDICPICDGDDIACTYDAFLDVDDMSDAVVDDASAA